MVFHFTNNSVIHLLTAVAAIFVVLLLLRFRKSDEVKYLILLQLSVAIWAITYAIEFAHTGLEEKVLWSKISYFGIAFLPLLYFLFTTAYSQKKYIITTKFILLLSIIPAVTIILALTNDKHRLIWPEVTLDPVENIAHYSHGIAFWVYFVYCEILLLIGLTNLIISIYNFPSFYKTQVGYLLAGSLIPIAGNLMYVTKINPYPGFDWTPVSFVLSGFIVTLGIVRFRMFDIVPLARTKLFEMLNDGVVVINSEKLIEDCNAEVYNIFNWQNKNLVLEPFEKVFGDYDKLIDGLNKNMASVQLEVSHENETKFYHVKISPIFNNNKKFTGNVLLFHDITSIVNTKEELKKTNKKLLSEIEKREKLIEDLDAFAHTVAHDLRNSLSSIFSASEIMDELIKQNDKELLTEISNLINHSANKSIQITHELLLLATTDKTAVERQPVEMGKIINNSKSHLTELIKNSNAEITEPGVWPVAIGYAPWIEEVWTNYISNAIKYGGNPPKIEIGADILLNGKVKFWVKDNGKGLTLQQQKMLFKKFVRLEPRKAEGYGLGLSIVKKIIDKLDGTVGVESEGNGNGSKFYFILPSVMEKTFAISKIDPKTEFISN